MHKTNILIIGGGHASLPLIKAASFLKKEGVEITVLNKGQWLYYSGMMPLYLGGFYGIDTIRINLKDLCARYGVEFFDDAVTEIDAHKKRVNTHSGSSYQSDMLIINTGVFSAGVADTANVFPVKPFDKLIELRDKLDQNPNASVLIVGAGAAGTEIAMNLSRKSSHQITLTEKQNRILPSFPKKVTQLLTSQLKQRGVDVQTSQELDDADYDRFDVIISATGNQSTLTKMNHDLPVLDDGRMRVSETLLADGFPDVFAAGDVAFVGSDGYRPIGVHAVKQGFTLKENVTRLLSGKPLIPYKPYPVSPLILSDGPQSGILCAGEFYFSGRSMSALKYALDHQWIESYKLPKGNRRSWFKLLKDGWDRDVES